MISDMTYIAKKIEDEFPWSLHSSRGWFATNFMIKNLSDENIHNVHYDVIVEEALRKQKVTQISKQPIKIIFATHHLF